MAKKEEAKEVEAVQPEAAPAPAAEPKKGGALKVVGIVAAAVVVLGIAVAGYGFWNGSQIKKYAKDSETMYAVTNDWDKAFDETDTAKIKTNVDEIIKDSDSALTELNKKSAPGKAKQLQKDLKEYFTISKKVATDAKAIVDWLVEIEVVTKQFSDMSSLDTSSPEAMATAVDKAKSDIDASVVKLNSMSVPDSIKTQHESFVKMLKSLSTMYGKLATALRANDLGALSAISSEFTTAASGFDSFDNTENTITKAWEKDKDRMDALDKSIKDAISSLKTTGFSF
jgi:uncharacterized protein HemX